MRTTPSDKRVRSFRPPRSEDVSSLTNTEIGTTSAFGNAAAEVGGGSGQKALTSSATLNDLISVVPTDLAGDLCRSHAASSAAARQPCMPATSRGVRPRRTKRCAMDVTAAGVPPQACAYSG